VGLTRIAILRPLFIAMVILALVVVGAVSYTKLGVDLYPNVDFPVTSVVTAYPGADPETVEQLVTKPIENAVAGLSGVDYIQSYSSEGLSYVVVVFKDGVDGNTASIDVQRMVGSLRGTFPVDVQDPSIVKADFNALPVMNISLSGSVGAAELYNLADQTISPQLSNVPGVSSVTIVGGLQRQIDVRVDPAKLRAYGLSILQVTNALASENVDIPAGTVTQSPLDYQVRLNAQVQDPQQLQNLVVATTASGPVYVRDVATVVDSFKKQTQLNRTDGVTSVGIQITKQADANSIQTTDGVKQVLTSLNKQLPPGTQLKVVTDSSTFTRQSLASVQNALIEAVILTGLVLLLFLHTWRSTTIVLLAIPTSLISTFAVMFALGFTLNMMSLMGLTLTVGILVDDSIVVLENIYRHLELGETPFSAALNGRSEIGLAAIAITLIDVVVYAPVAFMSGIVGQFFQQFGLVIVAATLFSLFVSFTLTPMLASRWLRLTDRASRSPLAVFGRLWEAGYDRLVAVYRVVLAWGLRFRWAVVLLGVVSFAAGIALVATNQIGTEFIPSADQGQFTITIQMPAGTTLAQTDAATKQLEAKLKQIPEIQDTFTAIGVAGQGTVSQPRYANIQVQLIPLANRNRSALQIAQEIRQLNGSIPGMSLSIQQPSIAGPGGPPIQVQIEGNDPTYLQKVADQVQAIVQNTLGAVDVQSSTTLGQPEIDIQINRAKVSDLGLTADQIGTAVRTAIGGTTATQFQPTGQKAIDVVVLTDGAQYSDLQAIRDIPLVGASGQQVTLGQVATIVKTSGPTQITRRDRERIITISADTNGRSLGDVSTEIQNRLNAINLQPGTTIKFGGDTQQQSQTFTSLIQALALSILLMYMLMVALYESLLFPFVVMLSLPLAVVGALGGLWLTGNTLNMMSMIGMIMLTGLVGKNAVLLVDYTNTLRKRGIERNAALLQAGPTRLRPILMTTSSMVVSMLPSALRLGEGSELRAPMAVVVIGGLVTSTILTLVFIPAAYTIADDVQNIVRRIFGRSDSGPGEFGEVKELEAAFDPVST